MNYSMVKSLALVCMVAISSFAFANAKNPGGELRGYKDTWWFNLGLGMGSIFGHEYTTKEGEHTEQAADEGAVLGTVSFNYALFDNQLISIRLTGLNVIWPDTYYAEDGTHVDLEGVTEVGILYGLMHKSKYFLAMASAGLAYVGANYDSHKHADDWDGDNGLWGTEIDHESYTESTVGIPLETQLFWTPSSVFGVGLIGTANINDEVPFAGVMLGIQLGNLR